MTPSDDWRHLVNVKYFGRHLLIEIGYCNLSFYILKPTWGQFTIKLPVVGLYIFIFLSKVFYAHSKKKSGDYLIKIVTLYIYTIWTINNYIGSTLISGRFMNRTALFSANWSDFSMLHNNKSPVLPCIFTNTHKLQATSTFHHRVPIILWVGARSPSLTLHAGAPILSFMNDIMAKNDITPHICFKSYP